MILLICFGLVMLYSTSSYESNMKFGDDMYYFRRQALISLASVMVAVILSRIDYHILIKLSGFIFVMAFVPDGACKSPLGVEGKRSQALAEARYSVSAVRDRQDCGDQHICPW